MESSEKIWRALKHNVQAYAEVEFITGERIYYKCEKDKGWREADKVLGKENNFVLIHHSSECYRCRHSYQLKKNQWITR